jgi:hypothetical protein
MTRRVASHIRQPHGALAFEIGRRGKATVIRSRLRDRAAAARYAAKVVNRSRIVANHPR